MGYDIEHFAAFMSNIKENGGNDIDVWDFKEL